MSPYDPSPTTEDLFLGGKLLVVQPARGFRAGLDAVLLAAAVDGPSDRPLRVLDAGAGVGTAGLCVAARLDHAEVTLVEIAPSLAALARANVERNGLGARVRVVEADLTGPAAAIEAAGILPTAYDVVIANPPYLEEGRHRLPADAVAAAAFGMQSGGLSAWLRFMSRAAAGGGLMLMIHRADALAEVLASIGNRFGGIRVLPVHPREGTPANRIIVSARKGSRAPLEVLAGMVLHKDDDTFRDEVKAMQRDGTALGRLAR